MGLLLPEVALLWVVQLGLVRGQLVAVAGQLAVLPLMLAGPQFVTVITPCLPQKHFRLQARHQKPAAAAA
jgi:hypothetical protein